MPSCRSENIRIDSVTTLMESVKSGCHRCFLADRIGQCQCNMAIPIRYTNGEAWFDTSRHLQIFFKAQGGALVLLDAKFVDDIKITGPRNHPVIFLEKFDIHFKFDPVSRGPWKLRFFGLNTGQDDDMIVQNDGDDKLLAISEFPLSRARRKERETKMNDIEPAAFASTNSSLSSIGTAASPIC